MEACDKNKVPHNIDHTRNADCHKRSLGISDSSKDRTEHVVSDNKKAGQDADISIYRLIQLIISSE